MNVNCDNAWLRNFIHKRGKDILNCTEKRGNRAKIVIEIAGKQRKSRSRMWKLREVECAEVTRSAENGRAVSSTRDV